MSENDLAAWCGQHLGARPRGERFRDGYLSTVIGLDLDDGRTVVLKVRPPDPRLDGCFEVQRHLHEAGFPCPEPLVEPAPLGEGTATAEAYVTGGERLPTNGREPGPFARWLVRLIRLAPAPDDVAPLEPSPPWTRWRHDEGALWPMPDDVDADLNAVTGPDWLDEAGRIARDRLTAGSGAAEVIGHGDWYTGNLRWAGDDLHVAHDWDSVLVDSEAATVGFAAAVYPAVRAGTEATVDESSGFLDAYEAASGRAFTSTEREVAWAAGLWLRAFDAKKQLVKHGAPKSLNRDEAEARARRSGWG